MHRFYLLFSVALCVCTGAFAQSSFWTNSTSPSTSSSTDRSSVSLGLRFTSDVSGSVTGVRFYKGSSNTGTHTGHLWTTNGSILASVTFKNETATGWQEATFTTPVKIVAKTTYVVSYTAPVGGYAINSKFAWTNLSRLPLRVSGTSPGVYAYGTGSKFPNSSWNSSNYWVDVVFKADSAPPAPAPIEGISLWSSGATPSVAADSDTAAVTLGLKFRSSVVGDVVGLRFYKGVGNNGVHVGNLWTSSGGKLAEVLFSGETASGWQQAKFATPVRIAANTTYVVSYLAPLGRYPVNEYFNWAAVNASPLQVSAPDAGVYAYGSTARFPTGSWHSSNYWVDVIFAPSESTPVITTFSLSGTVQGSSATLSLSGAKSGTTVTDGTGKYTFTGLANGLYVVSPSRSGYSFSPSSTAVTIASASVTGVNFSGTALPAPPPVVSLNWGSSPSSNVVGYNLYRATVATGPFARITGSPVTGTSYSDTGVSSGRTYYYLATAVDSLGLESVYSNQANATTN